MQNSLAIRQRFVSIRVWARLAGLVVGCTHLVSPAGANSDIQIDASTCAHAKSSDREFVEPQRLTSANGELCVQLTAQVSSNSIIYDGTQALPVLTPTYNGKLVGPMIRVKPGDSLKITVTNQLGDYLCNPPVNPSPGQLPDDPNLPQNFCWTNLHTHGLHVPPTDPADNVYRTIIPKQSHTFCYQIPATHVAGTFWYHPHHHGSVALQLIGGMAGALIIDGGLDQVMESHHIRERVMVLQMINVVKKNGQTTGQVSYSDVYDKWMSAKNAATGLTNRELHPRALRQRAATSPADKAPASVSPPDAPYQLINGVYTPVIKMNKGDIERWRFIHAGNDDAFNLSVVYDSCDSKSQRVPMCEIAIDGLPRGRIVEKYSNVIYPGYRWDVLFQAPDPGTYYLVNDALAASQTLGDAGFTKRFCLAKIVVSDSLDRDGATMPTCGDLAKAVPPFQDITKQDVKDWWKLQFDFPTPRPNMPKHFTINNEEFGGDRIDRYVRLGMAEEWRLETATGGKNKAGHPFHIHVNPFQQLIYDESAIKQTLVMHPPLQAAVGAEFVAARRDTKLVDVVWRSENQTSQPLKPGDTITIFGYFGDGRSFSGCMTVEQKSVADLLGLVLGLVNPNAAQNYVVDLDTRGHVTVESDQASIAGLVIGEIEYLVGTTSPAYRMTFLPAKKEIDSDPDDLKIVDRIWRDTLLVPTGSFEKVRMQFRDWSGKTVLHCHIVDHEDQGMMQNIYILKPAQSRPGGMHARSAPDTTFSPASLTRAPRFELPDAVGRIHSSDEFAGRTVLLMFFLGIDCPRCVEQLRVFAADADKLAAASVRVVAISAQSQRELAESMAELPDSASLPFLLLADEKQQVFEKYQCMRQEFPQHGTYVIGATGDVVWSATGNSPFMDLQRILAEISKLAEPD